MKKLKDIWNTCAKYLFLFAYSQRDTWFVFTAAKTPKWKHDRFFTPIPIQMYANNIYGCFNIQENVML